MAEGQLIELTKRLIGFIEKGKEQFENTKNSGIEGDFFSEVKPFADLVKDVCEEWSVLATSWIRSEDPPYLNEKQLLTALEHIEKISIQSFYPKTSRKLFFSSVQSAQYVLESILYNCEK